MCKGFVNLVESADELVDYFNSFEDNSLLTFDWETTGLEYDAIPLCLSLHHRGSSPCVVLVDYFFEDGIPMRELADILNKQFPRFKLMAHNSKYDYMIGVVNGVNPDAMNIRYDTLIMVHLVDPDLPKKLETRIKDDFSFSKKTFEEICGKKWQNINWSVNAEELKDLLVMYTGEDVYWETQLFYKYRKLLDEDAWRIHDRIEIPLVKIVADAKIRGVLIDVPLLKDLLVKCDNEWAKVQNEIYDECGCVFNLNSTKQKAEIFFNRMKLPVLSKTKKGAPQTNAATFEEWAEMGFHIGELLNKYSELQKLKTGYLIPIPNLVDENDVLRGDLNSCGTATGRFSSSNPNLQNMPNNVDFPVRAAFIPRPGYVFLNYDYSQLELRVMAHMSKDATFIDIFTHGRDPHGEVAKALGVTRRQAKTANFGVLYGLGDENFAKKFGVSTEAAHNIVENYHTTYAGFAKWKVATENFAKKNGYVKNLFGRKRVLHSASKSRYDKDFRFGDFSKDMRRSVNSIIQGTGADIVKLATIAMCKKFVELGLDAHFLLQVHDEIVIEVRKDQMIEARDIMVDCMEHTTELCVPLDVDGKIITRWNEMHDDDLPSLEKRFDYSLYSSLSNG